MTELPRVIGPEVLESQRRCEIFPTSARPGRIRSGPCSRAPGRGRPELFLGWIHI
jgi:hypothetical protein